MIQGSFLSRLLKGTADRSPVELKRTSKPALLAEAMFLPVMGLSVALASLAYATDRLKSFEDSNFRFLRPERGRDDTWPLIMFTREPCHSYD